MLREMTMRASRLVPGDGPPRKLARTAGTAPADLERQPVQIQTSSGPVQVPLGKFHDGCAGQYAGKTKFRETAEWKGKTGVFCGQLRHGKGAAVRCYTDAVGWMRSDESHTV